MKKGLENVNGFTVVNEDSTIRIDRWNFDDCTWADGKEDFWLTILSNGKVFWNDEEKIMVDSEGTKINSFKVSVSTRLFSIEF